MKGGQILAQGAPEDILTAGLVREIYGVDLNVTSVDGKPFLIPVQPGIFRKSIAIFVFFCYNVLLYVSYGRLWGLSPPAAAGKAAFPKWVR